MNLARRYGDWRQGGFRVREEPLQPPREIPEPELQARWFAGEFGREFPDAGGGTVQVLDFGRWNADPAGPTFVGALLSYGGAPPVNGGIEVGGGLRAEPPSPAPLLHVVPREAKDAPRHPGVPRVELDLSALEFAGPRPIAHDRCDAPLGAVEEAQATALLEAAAQFRLCRKAARLEALAERFGLPDALYQAVAETLGYRNNKLPFLLLAQRFPLAALRRDPAEIETLLFAGSGFLTACGFDSLPGGARAYLRGLWNRWWPRRAELEGLIVPVALWNFKGTRPVNHPQRRVAALAEIVRHWSIVETLSTAGADPAALRGFLTRLAHPHWETHYTLQSRRSPSRMALLGGSRVADMLANVFYPLAVRREPGLWKSYRGLAAPEVSRKVALANRRLFGPRPLPKEALKRAVIQQGLLQLFDDFCGACGGTCARCELPRRVEAWRSWM